MPRATFSAKWLEHLSFPAPTVAGAPVQVDYFDTAAGTSGFGLRVSSTGARTWMLFARAQRDGVLKMSRFKIGRYAAREGEGGLTLSQARTRAAELRRIIDAGGDPKALEDAAKVEKRQDAADTFGAIAVQFVKRHAKKKQKSWRETARILGVAIDDKDMPTEGPAPGTDYFAPLRRKPMSTIKRSDVAHLLDKIEDGNGPVMADRALAALRKLCNWHATRDDKFMSPIVRGMARTNPKERARTRTLNDAEIRAFWQASAAVTPKVYGAIVRTLLLTAQRREEVGNLSWVEIDDDTWTVPAERYKTKKANIVPLAPIALATIRNAGTVGDAWCFSTNGRSPFAGYTKSKQALDAAMLAELRKVDAKATLPPWTIHDLRRTARTIMARVKVEARTAEMVLGHVIPGVEGIYNQHPYIAEKRDALARLAAEVARVVNPDPAPSKPAGAPTSDNVVPIRAAR